MENEEIVALLVQEVAKLNNRFPSEVVKSGIQNSVLISVNIVGGEVRKVIYQITDKWDNKYQVENAIAQVITEKAAELGIPLVEIPE